MTSLFVLTLCSLPPMIPGTNLHMPEGLRFDSLNRYESTHCMQNSCCVRFLKQWKRGRKKFKETSASWMWKFWFPVGRIPEGIGSSLILGQLNNLRKV